MNAHGAAESEEKPRDLWQECVDADARERSGSSFEPGPVSDTPAAERHEILMLQLQLLTSSVMSQTDATRQLLSVLRHMQGADSQGS